MAETMLSFGFASRHIEHGGKEADYWIVIKF